MITVRTAKHFKNRSLCGCVRILLAATINKNTVNTAEINIYTMCCVLNTTGFASLLSGHSSSFYSLGHILIPLCPQHGISYHILCQKATHFVDSGRNKKDHTQRFTLWCGLYLLPFEDGRSITGFKYRSQLLYELFFTMDRSLIL